VPAVRLIFLKAALFINIIIIIVVVSLLISEIFSVKAWSDLENYVWGRSRSAIVTIALSCTVCELFDVQ